MPDEKANKDIYFLAASTTGKVEISRGRSKLLALAFIVANGSSAFTPAASKGIRPLNIPAFKDWLRASLGSDAKGSALVDFVLDKDVAHISFDTNSKLVTFGTTEYKNSIDFARLCQEVSVSNGIPNNSQDQGNASKPSLSAEQINAKYDAKSMPGKPQYAVNNYVSAIFANHDTKNKQINEIKSKLTTACGFINKIKYTVDSFEKIIIFNSMKMLKFNADTHFVKFNLEIMDIEDSITEKFTNEKYNKLNGELSGLIANLKNYAKEYKLKLKVLIEGVEKEAQNNSADFTDNFEDITNDYHGKLLSVNQQDNSAVYERLCQHILQDLSRQAEFNTELNKPKVIQSINELKEVMSKQPTPKKALQEGFRKFHPDKTGGDEVKLAICKFLTNLL